MPNWSEGVLKVRGTRQNIENFIRNGIAYCDYRYESAFNEQLGRAELLEKATPRDCETRIDNECIFIRKTMDLWIKDTKRMFINSETIECWIDEEDDNAIICLDIRQAWGVLSEDLQALSKKYKLDFKIFATESGMEFCQNVEIVNGEIVKDDQITFDDFKWEAPDPRLGG